MSTKPVPDCKIEDHIISVSEERSLAVLKETAYLFNALGEISRLRLMELLFDGPRCVSDLAQQTGQSMSLISQRLKILYHARLVEKERRGKHIYYSLLDEHIVHLLRNAFDHAQEHND